MATVLYIPLAAALVLAAGCGEPLNNDIFEDDAAFRAAIPEEADVALVAPDQASVRLDAQCEEGQLYSLTFGTMAFINDITTNFLASVRHVASQPITSRTSDSRTWGPYYLDDRDQFLTLTIERRQVREADELVDTYFYWLNASDTRDDLGDAVLWGHWDPEYELEVGVGELSWDHGYFSVDSPNPVEGFVTVAYDTRDMRLVEAFVDDLRPVGDAEGSGTTIDCAYVDDGDGGGWFSYENRSDIVQQSDAKEQLEVTSRWLPDGSGRSEGRYADGDLGMTVVSLVECWDVAACQVYYRDTLGLSEPVGEASMCSIDDVVIP